MVVARTRSLYSLMLHKLPPLLIGHLLRRLERLLEYSIASAERKHTNIVNGENET